MGFIIDKSLFGGGGNGAILDGVDSNIKATVFDYTNSNPLAVRLTDINGNYIAAGAGVQYTDGDVDTSITGTAIMWEDTGDTLRPVSASKPLPISIAQDIMLGTDFSDVFGTSDLTITESTIKNVKSINMAQLIPKIYDYVALSYTGSNLTGVVYKTGGSGGATVATLTLAYTGSQLDSITRT